jgi:predicted amidohydrolase
VRTLWRSREGPARAAGRGARWRMRVAAFQAPYRDYPAAGGAELVVPHLDRARAEGVELLCCPEALIGELANESDGDSPSAVALSVADGELDDAVAPLLGWGMTIVVGFTERESNGDLHNSAVVINDTVIAGIYRKTYPGTSVCRAGTELPIFSHAAMPFGVLICNDAHYIEPARVLAARGAQLLVVPVHGGHAPGKENAWRARGTNVLIARAVENGIPLVAADVAGWQGRRVSHGTTAIIDRQGTILAAASALEEDFVVADVDSEGPRGGSPANSLAVPTLRSRASSSPSGNDSHRAFGGRRSPKAPAMPSVPWRR